MGKKMLIALAILLMSVSADAANPAPLSKQLRLSMYTYNPEMFQQNSTGRYYRRWTSRRYGMIVGLGDALPKGTPAQVDTFHIDNPEIKVGKYTLFALPTIDSIPLKAWAATNGFNFDSLVLRVASAQTISVKRTPAKGARTITGPDILYFEGFVASQNRLGLDFRNPKVGSYYAKYWLDSLRYYGLDFMMPDEWSPMGQGAPANGWELFVAPFENNTSCWPTGSPYTSLQHNWTNTFDLAPPWGDANTSHSYGDIMDSLNKAMGGPDGYNAVVGDSFRAAGKFILPNYAVVPNGDGVTGGNFGSWTTSAIHAATRLGGYWYGEGCATNPSQSGQEHVCNAVVKACFQVKDSGIHMNVSWVRTGPFDFCNGVDVARARQNAFGLFADCLFPGNTNYYFGTTTRNYETYWFFTDQDWSVGNCVPNTYKGKVTGATTPTATSFSTDLSMPTNRFNGHLVDFITGADASAGTRRASAYNFTNGQLTTTAWPSAPSVGDSFIIQIRWADTSWNFCYNWGKYLGVPKTTRDTTLKGTDGVGQSYTIHKVTFGSPSDTSTVQAIAIGRYGRGSNYDTTATARVVTLPAGTWYELLPDEQATFDDPRTDSLGGGFVLAGPTTNIGNAQWKFFFRDTVLANSGLGSSPQLATLAIDSVHNDYNVEDDSLRFRMTTSSEAATEIRLLYSRTGFRTDSLSSDSAITIPYVASSTINRDGVFTGAQAGIETYTTYLSAWTVTGGTAWSTRQVASRQFVAATVPTISIGNGSNFEGSQIAFIVTLTTPQLTNTTYLVNTNNGTAQAGLNYIGLTNQLRTIEATHSADTFFVSTINDGIATASLTFSATISSPSGVVQLGSPTIGNGTIIDINNVATGVKASGGLLWTNGLLAY